MNTQQQQRNEFELFGACGYEIITAGKKFELWAIEEEGVEPFAEDEVVMYYNDYATHLMEEEEMDDPELTNEMYLICKYYGNCFGVQYDDREQTSVDCPEYEEWKYAQPSADVFICSEEANYTNDDNCDGCYVGSLDEEKQNGKKKKRAS